MGYEKYYQIQQPKVRKSLGKLVNLDCYSTAEFKLPCAAFVQIMHCVVMMAGSGIKSAFKG